MNEMRNVFNLSPQLQRPRTPSPHRSPSPRLSPSYIPTLSWPPDPVIFDMPDVRGKKFFFFLCDDVNRMNKFP